MEKKKLFGNSMLLSIRTFVTMALTLYSSRLILRNLGVVDYGIFNVVGGVALFFSFFNNALSISTQRFITVALGKGSLRRLREVFSMSVNCHLMIALLIFVVAETLGLWFLNNKINIPESQMGAANVVYQACLAGCLLGVINVPYTGAIIAYERMRFLAGLSVLGAVLKVGVCLMIALFGSGRLVAFSLMLLGISVITFVINRIYCRTQLAGCRWQRGYNKPLFSQILRFSGWNMLKMCANMGVIQGYNIIVNIFGGPIASAAMGFASQISNAANAFMTNVQTAFNPQITRHVATGSPKQYGELIGLSIKFSMFMLLIFSLPLMLNIHYVLHLWLGIYPMDTATLCQFALVSIMADCFVGPLTTVVMAHGKISRYQAVTSTLLLVAIPAAWFALSGGMAIRYILITKIVAQALIAIYAVIYICRHLGIGVRTLVFGIYCRTAGMALIAGGLSYVFARPIVHSSQVGQLGVVALTTLISWGVLVVAGLLVGSDRTDRANLAAYIKQRLPHH